MNGQKISAVTKFKQMSGQVSGSLDITTPFQPFSDIGADFTHSGDLNRFNTEANLR